MITEIKGLERIQSFYTQMYNRILDYYDGEFKLWLAGGAIRDIIIGREPKDLDFYTDLDATQIKKFIKFDCTRGNQNPLELKKKDETYCVHPLIGEIQIQDYFPPHKSFVAQIMSLADTPELQNSESLVKSFDWEISQFCYDGKNLIIGQLPPLDHITVKFLDLSNKENRTGAQSSLNRGIKFSARYGMPIRDSDIFLLVKKAVDQEVEKIKGKK